MSLGRAARLGGLIGLWLSAPFLAAYAIWYNVAGGGFGMDAHAYWLTAHHESLYAGNPGTRDAYLYSPLFAQAIHPLTLLPWPAFLGLWMLVETAAFAWVLKPLGWRWGLPLLLLCTPAVVVGNIHGLLTLACVLGLRAHPGFWTFPAVTKVMMGAIGPVWFAARGEWRQLARLTAWGAGLVTLSYALWPSAWVAWVEFLRSAAGSSAPGSDSVLLRAALALVLTTIAARRDWLWAAPCAMALATPVLGGDQVLLLLIACVRLYEKTPDLDFEHMEATR